MLFLVGNNVKSADDQTKEGESEYREGMRTAWNLRLELPAACVVRESNPLGKAFRQISAKNAPNGRFSPYFDAFVMPKASQPVCPNSRKVAMFFSKISAASGKAATALSMLSSRSKCRVG